MARTSSSVQSFLYAGTRSLLQALSPTYWQEPAVVSIPLTVVGITSHPQTPLTVAGTSSRRLTQTLWQELAVVC